MLNLGPDFGDNVSTLPTWPKGLPDFPGLTITCVNRHELVVDIWKELEQYAGDPFSDYAWASAWYDAHRQQGKYSPVIVIGRTITGQPAFLLPLFMQKTGPFRILLRPARKHSACFSGLFRPDYRHLITKDNAARFWKSVLSTLKFADIIAIDGLIEDELAQNNPLQYLPRSASGNASYRIQISGDWNQQYQSTTSSKARSNDRRCRKRLAENGHLEYHVGHSKKERLMMLEALLDQKSAQFNSLKTPDPFAGKAVQKFYQSLIEAYDHQEQNKFFISAIMLNGEPIAVNLGIFHGKALHGLIMTMKQGEFKRFSPGRLLMLDTNSFLAENGFEAHDFGVGEFDYKTAWHPTATTRYDIFVPLSFKGRLLARLLRSATVMKSLIRRSRFTKKLVLRIAFALRS